MSYWEMFTWITVFVLSIGSITVFVFFVKDIKTVLEKFLKGSK